MSEKARAHLIITGKVQGVFFRAETCRAAEIYGVTGWVRNLPDKSVEAVVEGDAEDVQSLINWCWKGSPHSVVDEVQVRHQDYQGEFDGFRIAY